MALKLKCTARQYAIEIAYDAFNALEDAEDRYLIPYEEFLFQKLDKIPGVDSTEYNGHFGAAIYCRIDAEDDTKQTQSVILSTIQDHIVLCKRQRAKKAA